MSVVTSPMSASTVCFRATIDTSTLPDELGRVRRRRRRRTSRIRASNARIAAFVSAFVVLGLLIARPIVRPEATRTIVIHATMVEGSGAMAGEGAISRR
jgi:hypothetical protein